jgi:hypothetical protein
LHYKIQLSSSDTDSSNYLKKFSLIDAANKERHFANRTYTFAALIPEGMGYGVLPAEFTKPYITGNQLAVVSL